MRFNGLDQTTLKVLGTIVKFLLHVDLDLKLNLVILSKEDWVIAISLVSSASLLRIQIESKNCLKLITKKDNMQSILLKTVKKEELLLVISSHACKVSQYFQEIIKKSFGSLLLRKSGPKFTVPTKEQKQDKLIMHLEMFQELQPGNSNLMMISVTSFKRFSKLIEIITLWLVDVPLKTKNKLSILQKWDSLEVMRMDYSMLMNSQMTMETMYNLCRLEILGAAMNGLEIGVMILTFGLMN